MSIQLEFMFVWVWDFLFAVIFLAASKSIKQNDVPDKPKNKNG